MCEYFGFKIHEHFCGFGGGFGSFCGFEDGGRRDHDRHGHHFRFRRGGRGGDWD